MWELQKPYDHLHRACSRWVEVALSWVSGMVLVYNFEEPIKPLFIQTAHD